MEQLQCSAVPQTASGQKQTSDWRPLMSALPQKRTLQTTVGCPLCVISGASALQQNCLLLDHSFGAHAAEYLQSKGEQILGANGDLCFPEGILFHVPRGEFLD
jgi:hypothetical protein